MSAYTIGIGGTGARGVEALLHLCAAGLGPKKLFILLIDPDKANGNLNRVKQLITRYEICRSFVQPGTKSGLFQTEIKYSTENNQPLLIWSPTVDETTLKDYFRYDLLSDEMKKTARMLYTPSELEMSLELGFRGHSSVGAPVMARIGMLLGQKPWSEFIQSMQEDIQRGENAAVFVYASIFGATGASGFPTVGRILKDAAKTWPNSDKLRLGGNLMLPYFGFKQGSESDGELRARAELFLLNSKAALNHYQFQWRQDANNPYESMYFLGDSKPESDGREPSLGGQAQTNPAHYLEILSGHSALHFFGEHGIETDKGISISERQKNYAGRALEGIVRWEDLPGQHVLRDRVVKLASFAAAYLHFYFPLISNPQFEANRSLSPWYSRNFRSGELTSGDATRQQKVLREYCQLLAQWLYEIHTYTGGRDPQLLNPAVLRRAQATKFEKWPTEDFNTLKFCGPTDPKPKLKRSYDDVLDFMNKKEPDDIEMHMGRFADMLYNSVATFCVGHYSLTKRG
jgi:hypothetical protein